MRWNHLGWGAVAGAVALTAFMPAAVAVGPGHNGLSSQALNSNALTTNPKALTILVARNLDQALLDDSYIKVQLQDARARAVMEDLVKCALNPSATALTYTDRTGTQYVWNGESGLCGAGSPAGDWSQNPPTTMCQELVSACLFARVNGLGRFIPISLRGPKSLGGQPSNLFSLSNHVHTEKTYRECAPGTHLCQGMPIRAAVGPVCLPGQDCGWEPAYVGMCRPGTQIQLSFQDPSVCNSTSLRVCDGLYGCPDPNVNIPTDPQRYSGFVWEKPTGACSASPLQFTCPTDPIAGYYSVMIGRHGTQNRTSMNDLMVSESSDPTVVLAADAGTYPAPEQYVFTFREAAFYGNLFEFGPEKLTRCREVVPQGAQSSCPPPSPNEPESEQCPSPRSGWT